MTARNTKVTDAYERCQMARNELGRLDARCMEATEDKAGILWERWLLPNGVSVVLFATPHWWDVFRPTAWTPRVEATLESLREVAAGNPYERIQTIGDLARAGEAAVPPVPIEYTLIYMRKAYRVRDGADGFLYRLAWETGNEERIFATVTDVHTWAERETAAGRPTTVEGAP